MIKNILTYFVVTFYNDLFLYLFARIVIECQSTLKGTHSFDIYGAMTAYFAFILCVVYGIDAFFKYKEWKLLNMGMNNGRIENTSGTINLLCTCVRIFNV